MSAVELVRTKVARQVVELKGFISQIDGPKDMLARLSGSEGEHRLHRLVEMIMSELGVQTQTDSAARKAIKRVTGS